MGPLSFLRKVTLSAYTNLLNTTLSFFPLYCLSTSCLDSEEKDLQGVAWIVPVLSEVKEENQEIPSILLPQQLASLWLLSGV